MKVVLHGDVDGVGRRGDVIDVADGYARNFLMPRGLAVKATRGAESQAVAMRRVSAERAAADRAEAEEIATKLVPNTITIAATATEAGHLFGSVSANDIAEAVHLQTGIELDRRSLELEHALKDVGTHSVVCKLHAEVEFPITVQVVADS